MKKLTVVALVLFSFASRVTAGTYYDLSQGATSATMKIVGRATVGPTVAGATLNGAPSGFFAGGPMPWIDVRAYGAWGDGAHDDTTAIQNAINAASNIDGQGSPAKVFVPTGIYLINATGLTLSGNAGVSSNGQGIELTGEGMGSQFLSQSSTMTILTVTGNRNAVRNLFFNSYSTQTLVTDINVDARATNTNFNRLDSNYYQNSSTAVVVQSSVSWGAAYTQITNSDMLAVSKCAIWLRTATNSAMNTNGTYVANVRAGSAPNAYGLYLDGAGQTTVNGFAAEGLNYGIFVASSPFNSQYGGAEGTSIFGGRYEAETIADIFISTWGTYTAIYGGDLEFGLGSHIVDLGNNTTFLGNPSIVSFPGYCYGGAGCASDGNIHISKQIWVGTMTVTAPALMVGTQTANGLPPLGYEYHEQDTTVDAGIYNVNNNQTATLASASNYACNGTVAANCAFMTADGVGVTPVGMFQPNTAVFGSGVSVLSGISIIARGTGAGQYIRFGTGSANGTQRMSIDPSGNIDMGSGATVSTFTATGALTMASGANITFSGGGTIAGIGTFGDSQVAISTGGVTAGKFGDNRVGISTAAVTGGKFGDTQVAVTTAAVANVNYSTGAVNQAVPMYNGTGGLLSPSLVTQSGTTVSVAGDLNVNSSTFSTSGGGYSAPSQPCARFWLQTFQVMPNNAETSVYFQNTEFSNGGITLVAASSDTFTVPTGQAGRYDINVGVGFSASGTGFRYAYILSGANQYGTQIIPPVGTAGTTVNLGDTLNLAAGATIKIKAFQNSGGNLNVGSNAATDRSTFVKICKAN